MCVCLWGSTEAVGGAVSRPRPQRRPPKKTKVDPIDVIPSAQNIDIQRVRNERKRHSYRSNTAAYGCLSCLHLRFHSNHFVVFYFHPVFDCCL